MLKFMFEHEIRAAEIPVSIGTDVGSFNSKKSSKIVAFDRGLMPYIFQSQEFDGFN